MSIAAAIEAGIKQEQVDYQFNMAARLEKLADRHPVGSAAHNYCVREAADRFDFALRLEAGVIR